MDTCKTIALLVASLLAGPLCGQADPYRGHIAQTKPKTPAEEKKAFRLPPGYEAQLVASEPDINKPMNIAFDEKGRLWVTSTIEYPFPVEPGKKTRDTVKILSDIGPDGKARKITTYAEDVNIPIGLLPNSSEGRSLVFSIPSIYELTDADGDGKADKRRVLFTEFGKRDTHGLTSSFTWGFDGWIYACHGFSNQSTIKGKDTKPITMQSGNTYRMRADGSGLEQFTWGQVNPFGMAFDSLGNLYTADCHTKPIYQLIRGAYYPSFGKPHDGLGFGPEMINHSHGSTAISGVVYYTAEHFPKKNDTVFIGNVITNRINHDRIAFFGSRPNAVKQPDFLVSEDPWFRPVDLELGPDGALYVADFYNRIIGHYEVPLTHPQRDRTRGRIWRIVYRGPDGKAKPPAPPIDRTKRTDAELIDDLAHPNLTVRMQATNLLVRRNNEKTKATLRALFDDMERVTPKRERQWMHSLWALFRTDALPHAILKRAASEKAPLGVQVHAFRILGEMPKWAERERNLVSGALLRKPMVTRVAIEALGLHPHQSNPNLLNAVLPTLPLGDTHLRHTWKIALRNQYLDESVWNDKPFQGLEVPNSRQYLGEVMLGVHSSRASKFLLDLVTKDTFVLDSRLEEITHIARFGKADHKSELRNWLKEKFADDPIGQARRFRAFHTGVQSSGKKLTRDEREWGSGLAVALLDSSEADERLAGLGIASLIRSPKLVDRIEAIASDKKAASGQRSEALTALGAIDSVGHAKLIGGILGDGDAPMSLRQQAAQILSQREHEATRGQLVEKLALAPNRLQTVIAIGLSNTRTGAAALLSAIEKGKASARLLQQPGVHIRLSKSGIPNVEAKLADLTKGLTPIDEKIRRQIQQRRMWFRTVKRDSERGSKVFEKRCAICHQIGGKGAKIGPQLDGIGNRGLDRLLEDTLDPNRNVDGAFRMTAIETKAGQVLSGLVLREEGAVVVLADLKGKEVRIPKAQIDERTTTTLSPMPANILEEVKEGEFYDLLEYLLRQRTPLPSPK